MTGGKRILDGRRLTRVELTEQAQEAMQQMGSGTLEITVNSRQARLDVMALAEDNGWEITIERLPGNEEKLILER